MSHRRLTTKWMWADMSVIDCSMLKMSDQLLIKRDMKTKGEFLEKSGDDVSFEYKQKGE